MRQEIYLKIIMIIDMFRIKKNYQKLDMFKDHNNMN